MSPWWPVGVLAVGVGLTTVGIQPQRSVPLRAGLGESISREFDGWVGEDRTISKAEQRVAGMDAYVLRIYASASAQPEDTKPSEFSVYVGYYQQQAQGRTIHSPKNCLPGAGWEPLVSDRRTIETALGPATVNRYLIGNGPAKAIVLYWYQGRGRIEANEYVVKWELLRDQALHGRSDEALVRIMVPFTVSEAAASAHAERIAAQLVTDVDRALVPRRARL